VSGQGGPEVSAILEATGIAAAKAMKFTDVGDGKHV
jgi:hypothetical protein